MYTSFLNQNFAVLTVDQHKHHPQIFFSFGNLDLIIGNHFTDNYSSFTNFPDSYKNVGKDYKYKITGGLYHFRIKALEAYEIILNNK